MPMIYDTDPPTTSIECNANRLYYIVTINPESRTTESSPCSQIIQSWLSDHFEQVAVQAISIEALHLLIDSDGLGKIFTWSFPTPLGTLHWLGLSANQIQRLRAAKPEVNGDEMFVLNQPSPLRLQTTRIIQIQSEQTSNCLYLIGANKTSPYYHPTEVPRPILEWLAINCPDVGIADCHLNDLLLPAYIPAMKVLSEDWAVLSSLPGPLFQLQMSHEQAELFNNDPIWCCDAADGDGLYSVTFSFSSDGCQANPKLFALLGVVGTTVAERLAASGQNRKG